MTEELEAKSTVSQHQYSLKMTVGLEKSITFKFRERATTEIESTVKRRKTVKKKKKKKTVLNIIGDIDLIVRISSGDLALTEYLPSTNYYTVRPMSARDQMFHGLLCEFKSSCTPQNMKKNLIQFVKFYFNITNPNTLETLVLAKENMRDLLTDITVPLLFIFNGADNADTWKCMQEVIKETCGTNDGTKIREHPVVTIYCPAEDMIMEKERLIMEKERLEIAQRESVLMNQMMEKDDEINRLMKLLEGQNIK